MLAGVAGVEQDGGVRVEDVLHATLQCGVFGSVTSLQTSIKHGARPDQQTWKWDTFKSRDSVIWSAVPGG